MYVLCVKCTGETPNAVTIHGMTEEPGLAEAWLKAGTAGHGATSVFEIEEGEIFGDELVPQDSI